SAKSHALDVALKPGMSAIEEAKFSGAVRFEEGALTATSAAARYLLERGVIELAGTEAPPRPAVPHVANTQIAVDAARIDLTLAGPKMKATGTVKSVLKPQKKGADTAGTRIPAMLKQDQPVNVVSDELERAEAYEDVTLRESGRTTTGTRMTYFADTERYEVLGAPVKIVDQCGGETMGKTLTFNKTTDTIVLDGRKQFRTQSKGASKCG